MAFQPKQITQYQAEHLSELQGDVSEQATRFTLSLLSPFKEGEMLHDNACGSGAVTETIMRQGPPAIHIHATDINPNLCKAWLL
jgi:ubiquinone/menaquinone biosynthesis C-methylase UbiE